MAANVECLWKGKMTTPKLTEEQKYLRKRARHSTTQAKHKIKQSNAWHPINTNRSRFFCEGAYAWAHQAATLAFRAHPELREP